MPTLQTIERIGASAYAGAFALLPILAEHGVVSEWIVAAVGVVSTAVVAAWTGSKVVTNRTATTPTVDPGSSPVV